MAGNHQKGRHQIDHSFDLKRFNQEHKNWIQKEFTSQTIEFAEKFGKFLVDNRLTTSQIRNIFGEVKRIEANAANKFPKKDFLLLRPKIAYAAKRAGSRGIIVFKEVMDKLHIAVFEKTDETSIQEAFQNFVDLFEAILAYHKAAGGQ